MMSFLDLANYTRIGTTIALECKLARLFQEFIVAVPMIRRQLTHSTVTAYARKNLSIFYKFI